MTPGRGKVGGVKKNVDSKEMTPEQRSHENESEHTNRAVTPVPGTVWGARTGR